MRIEFLLITKQDDEFCNSQETFINLLKSNSTLSITTKKINYKPNEFQVNYQLYTGEISGKKQRYFHMVLIHEDTNPDEHIESFSQLIRTIKKMFERLKFDNASIDIIWDDISYYYSLKAYPIINEIENLMRKLIIKFMVVNVGIDWMDTTTPDDMKEKFQKRQKNKNAFQSIIYETDFIQLSQYLSFNYRTVKNNQIENVIKSAKKAEDLDIQLLKNYLPKSNWERYFEGKIDYKAEQLFNDWDDLYQLRNKIAHNRGIAKSDFERIQQLASQIKAALGEAINKLETGSIELSEEQKLDVMSEVSSINPVTIEDKIIIALGEAEEWIKTLQNPKAFIGLSFFVDKFLSEKGMERRESLDLIRAMNEKGLINVYQQPPLVDGGYPTSAIKRCFTQNEEN